MSTKGIFADLLSERKNILNLVIITVVASIGVNLVADSLIVLFMSHFQTVFVIGIALCISSILYFLVVLLNKRTKIRSYLGFFIIDYKKKEVIPINRYSFATDLSDYIIAATQENQDIKNLWERSFAVPSDETESERFGRISSETPSRILIKEATEYFVLRLLSLHLFDYFNKPGFKEKDLEKMGRKHIPAILMQNRFLELFSRPTEERAAFADDPRLPDMVFGYSRSGALFEEFELVLPKKSAVSRHDENTIKIETRVFTLKISVMYSALRESVLPLRFHMYYLESKNLKDILENTTERDVRLTVEISFKFPFLFSSRGMQYYNWIDSFLDLLENEFSAESFFNKIQWESSLTVIEWIDRKFRQSIEKKKEDTC